MLDVYLVVLKSAKNAINSFFNSFFFFEKTIFNPKDACCGIKENIDLFCGSISFDILHYFFDFKAL